MGATIGVQKEGLHLKDAASNTVGKDLGIPNYILKSRPWRWAHEQQNSGNPYRKDSKCWRVFNFLNEKHLTLPELVTATEGDTQLSEKLSYLLTIYEVVSQCLAAGLLVMDTGTRKIGACQGTPQPAKML